MTDSSANPRNYGERPLHEDDPLMELSRIVDFGAPAGDNTAWNERRSHDQFENDRVEPGFDPALDLERELLGNFDDYTQPADAGQYAEPEAVQGQRYADPYRRGAEPLVQEEDLASALEEEFDLHLDAGAPAPAPELSGLEDVERSEPVPQFDYADYSDARDSYGDRYATQTATYDDHEASVTDQGAYDPTIYQPAIEPHEESYLAQAASRHDWDVQAVEPSYATEPAHQPQSLEDELENLLFGDQPQAVETTEDAAYGYEAEPVSYARQADGYETEEPAFDEPQQPVAAAFAPDRTEPSAYPYYPRGNFGAGVTTQMPAAPVQAQAPSVASHEPEAAFDDDFSFDAEEPVAVAAEATDDDLTDLDELSLSDDDFGFDPSGDHHAEEEEPFDTEDFFTEDDLDLGVEDAADAVSPTYSNPAYANPAYAHAVLADEDYRPSAGLPHFASAQQAASAPAPEVETLSVAENKVEQTHSLDLPDVDYGEEETAAGLNELEAEFAEVFNTVGIDESNTVSDAQSEADKAFEDIFRESASSYLPNAGVAAGPALGLGAAAVAAAFDRSQQSGDTAGSENDFYNHWAAQGGQNADSSDYGARAAARPVEDDIGQAAEAYRNRPVRGRRGLLLASVAGAIVLLGGIGYHFLGGGSQGPVVIHADNQPIKVQPESPGGVTVPNQDKAVYDRVAGTLPNNPEQKALISSGEEPVDISGTGDSEDTADNTPPQDPAGASGQTAQANAGQNPPKNAPLIQPREVETMIVRPDGTIMKSVPDAAPQPAEPQTANNAAQPPAVPSGGDDIAAIASGNAVPDAAASAPQARQPAAQPALPVHAPVVPSRPAEQSVNTVGNVAQGTKTQAPQASAPLVPTTNQQVASAAGGGGYFIQIASQPSAELAQKSYASMAQKFANVIGGHGVDIKRADIPGKGTYYRVRVQAGSRDDANALCSRLKSAGGSCLVTR